MMMFELFIIRSDDKPFFSHSVTVATVVANGKNFSSLRVERGDFYRFSLCSAVLAKVQMFLYGHGMT